MDDDKFQVGTGQAHELALAFGRNGWTNGDIKRLSEGDLLTQLLPVVRGQAEVKIFEQASPAAPAPKPSLVGTVVKTLRLNSYTAKSIAKAIKDGQYENNTAAIVKQFGGDEVGLTGAVTVELVQFDREPWHDEMLAWATQNNKRPIVTAHLLGIGIQHPDEQRRAPIVELGSVRDGGVLCLYDDSGWRDLYRRTVKSYWNRSCLFGFVSEL